MAAKFTFVGNPRNASDQRDEVTFDGVAFKRGEAVTVEDEKIAKKLRSNTHFLEDGKKAPLDQRTEVAKANQKPVDPRATVVATYKGADNPGAAVQQGAGNSGFGYNDEADEADRRLAHEYREKAKAESDGRRPKDAPADRPVEAQKPGLKPIR